MNARLVFGTLLCVISGVICVAMMNTFGWIVYDDDDYNIHLKFGLKKYKDSQGSTHDISSADGCGIFQCGDLSKGGDILIATGSIGMAILVASVIFLFCAHSKGRSMWRFWSLFGLYVVAFLVMLGAVLYAKKAYAGYSFIIMAFASFFYLSGVTLLVLSGWGFDKQTVAPPAQRPNFSNI